MRQIFRSSRRVQASVLLAACGALLTAQPALAWVGGEFGAPDGIPQAWGVNPEHARQNYGSNGTLRVQMIRSNITANVLYPGDKASMTFQFVNLSDQPVRAAGRFVVRQYGLETPTSDQFRLLMFKIVDVGGVPFRLDVAPRGFQNVTIAPPIPERKGGYAILADLPGQDRLFAAACIRTFAAAPGSPLEPRMSMDRLSAPMFKRLGVKMVRHAISYKPTSDPDFPQWYAEEVRKLRELEKNGIRAMVMWGGGAHRHPNQPLGRPRPQLNDRGVMQGGSIDLAWLPSYDRDFQKVVTRFASELGYPRGPINAMLLWNEPWEGASISGWGADMIRYREIFSHMARGVEEARRTAKVRVLLGGADSSSNTFDKFFPGDSNEFLKWLDFVSVHYQGMQPPSLVKEWRNRKHPYGRVRVWDTESWVGNSEDRVGVVVAANRSTGHDSAMGTYGGNAEYTREIEDRSGPTLQRREVTHAWSMGAGIGAVQHFIGERAFQEMVFKNGLPWVMRFNGLNNNPDDGTLVVVGDLGATFNPNSLPFRSVKGFNDAARRVAMQKKLAALPSASALAEGDLRRVERRRLEEMLGRKLPLEGASMTFSDGGGRFKLFDFYGNLLRSQAGKITVPLNGKGYFLRATSGRGSFADLVRTVRSAWISGLEPLDIVAHDLTAPIGQGATLRLTLTNVLNRPLQGSFNTRLSNLKLRGASGKLSFKPHETKVVSFAVAGGAASAANSYPLSFSFDAGRSGRALHQETMRANVIHKRSIKVDGRLDDWQGALPQTVTGASERTMTEAAWLPFMPFKAAPKTGLASGFAAHDAKYFYFAAKIADSTPDPGTIRFAKRDDDAYFYPKVSYADPSQSGGESFSARWSGEVLAPTAGTYTFALESDDGSRLYVNDRLLIDNWRDQGPTEMQGSVRLEAGRHSIRIEYYNSEGGGAARLRWKAPGGATELVPPSRLFPAGMNSGINPQVGNGLRGEYFRDRDFQIRVVTRLDPQVNFVFNGAPDPAFDTKAPLPMVWPDGVRRYSYRRQPVLPSGDEPYHDNVQIGFNALPAGIDDWAAMHPGTRFGYVGYKAMDYEYALNKVAPQFGGGYEVWRLQVPGMPRKHFYPRQPRSKYDGAVPNAKVMVRHEGNTRTMEAAIPWSEIPHVKRLLDTGQPVKFDFKINDSAGYSLDFARNRSASNQNGLAFHVDWKGSWAPEIEWGWGK